MLQEQDISYVITDHIVYDVDSKSNKLEMYQNKCISTWSIFIAVVLESVGRLDFSK